MVPTQRLYDIADNNNIAIYFRDLPWPVQGVYKCVDGCRPIILLHSMLPNETTLRCVLAEELGHHFTTDCDTIGTYLNYGQAVLTHIAEFRARKWAVKQLVHLGKIAAIASRDILPHEIAEYFQVTEEYVRLGLMFAKEEQKKARGGSSSGIKGDEAVFHKGSREYFPQR